METGHTNCGLLMLEEKEPEGTERKIFKIETHYSLQWIHPARDDDYLSLSFKEKDSLDYIRRERISFVVFMAASYCLML